MAERLLRGWGRTAPTSARVEAPADAAEVARLVAAAGPRGVLARGLGRSYGDAAQNAGGLVLDMRLIDDIGAIDPATGEVTCGAGVSLDTVLRHCLPLGWFVPVTPGTRFVTLGGAVAADVHGKNHHRDGTIGRHVTQLQLVDGHGELQWIAPADPAFAGVLGGLGLTGAVTAVRLRLLRVESSWFAVDTIRTANLDETLAALADADERHRYSVAWVDCLADGAAAGRGVLTAGDHLPADAVPRGTDPLAFAPRMLATTAPRLPGWALGRPQMAAFNAAYHRAAPRHATATPTRAAAFFYPLDVVGGWNRLYGADGFVQHQFVSPDAETVRAVLRLFRSAGVPGLLAVLKRFGPAADAPLSFPAPGWTLAVDLPARSAGLAAALDAADELVHSAGGRVYLAKDARVRPRLLAEMYPQLPRWRELRAAADPDGVFTSDLARRLDL